MYSEFFIHLLMQRHPETMIREDLITKRKQQRTILHLNNLTNIFFLKQSLTLKFIIWSWVSVTDISLISPPNFILTAVGTSPEGRTASVPRSDDIFPMKREVRSSVQMIYQRSQMYLSTDVKVSWKKVFEKKTLFRDALLLYSTLYNCERTYFSF